MTGPRDHEGESLERPALGHLPDPIKDALEVSVDEARIHAIWRRTGVPERSRAADARRRWAFALGTATALAAAIVAGWLTFGPPRSAGPLALADGAPPEGVAADAPTTLALSDGSTIALEAGAIVTPERNDAEHFHLRLRRGRARFSVTPGGPRRWSIDCGDATVEVVGTIFTIDRAQSRVQVSVERGEVHVTDARGVVHVLRAGESISVPSTELASSTAEEPSPPAAVVEPSQEVAEPSQGVVEPSEAVLSTPPGTSPTHHQRWHHLARRGEYREAYAALRGEPAAPRPETAEELLLLADVARLSGHPDEAVAPLDRILREHASAPEARVAGVLLGRIQEDELHAPRDAARTFEGVLARGVPRSMRDDVEGRLARSLHDAGDPRAEERARAYLRDFPEGQHAEAIRRWLGP